MLESVTLRNFQRHRKLVVTFAPGVTTIIGSSDVGKSAVLRALRWLCLNKGGSPRTIMRKGARFVKCTLEIDKHTVSRFKGSGKNTYVLDGKKFSAVKSDVPEQVGLLLNITDTNFQQQHDSPYWFAKSSGQVSRELNQIVNLGVIDQTLANVAADLRKTRATLEVTRDRLEKARARKEELVWIRDMEKDLARVVESKQNVENKGARAARLETLVKEIQETQEANERRETMLVEVRACVAKGANARRLWAKEARLESLVEQIKRLGTKQWQSKQELDTAKRKLERMLVGTCPVCGRTIQS